MEKVEAAIAVGHIPSGLFVVCTHDGEKEGFLASWVQQVSFSPLLVALAIKEGRPPSQAIMAGKVFSINVVGEHETQYMKHFWSGYRENPFGEIPHKAGVNGGIIIDGAKSAMECRMVEKWQPGDHQIAVAEVLSSYVLNSEARPKTHIRKTGKEY